MKRRLVVAGVRGRTEVVDIRWMERAKFQKLLRDIFTRDEPLTKEEAIAMLAPEQPRLAS